MHDRMPRHARGLQSARRHYSVMGDYDILTGVIFKNASGDVAERASVKLGAEVVCCVQCRFVSALHRP
ncbi:hypothetical protein BaRGS_00025973, partial [Batillaria attramentaria]